MFSPIFVADTKIIYDYKFVAPLTSMEFETENGCKKRTNNSVLEFLLACIKMVKRLLNFIKLSWSCNWLLHFKSIEEMMLGFSSMNRMKYRRMWPVYITDMYDFQHRAPDL